MEIDKLNKSKEILASIEALKQLQKAIKPYPVFIISKSIKVINYCYDRDEVQIPQSLESDITNLLQSYINNKIPELQKEFDNL